MILDMSQDTRCPVCGESGAHECRRVETLIRTCPLCGKPMWQKHMEVCTGEPPLSPRELAEIIVAGGAFVDADAVRVARAYLEVVVPEDAA